MQPLLARDSRNTGVRSWSSPHATATCSATMTKTILQHSTRTPMNLWSTNILAGIACNSHMVAYRGHAPDCVLGSDSQRPTTHRLPRLTTPSPDRSVKQRVCHSELAFLAGRKEIFSMQDLLPAFAIRNCRVSREDASETQLAPSVLPWEQPDSPQIMN